MKGGLPRLAERAHAAVRAPRADTRLAGLKLLGVLLASAAEDRLMRELLRTLYTVADRDSDEAVRRLAQQLLHTAVAGATP